MQTRRNLRGFTLVEIMIVVLIIGILMAIAVPNFVRAREVGRRNACMSNLKQLDNAKETWAMAMNAPTGSVVTMADLTGPGNYLKGPASGPACPSGGTYSLNVIGTNPACSQAPAPELHILP